MKKNLANLSKLVSHALRHEPELYGLELNDEGWVSVDALLLALQGHIEMANPMKADLVAMIAQSEKKRHEMSHDMIKALHGYSLLANHLLLFINVLREYGLQAVLYLFAFI